MTAPTPASAARVEPRRAWSSTRLGRARFPTVRGRARLPMFRGWTRLPALVVGCALLALGIAAALESELGVGPYDVLIDGVAGQAGVSFGVASVAVGVVFVAGGRALGGPVGLGTVVAVALVGPLVDGWRLLVPSPDALALQAGQLAVAVPVIAVGLGLMIAARLGVGPVDVLMLGLTRRGLSLRWVRTGLEVAVAAGGWAMGGPLGVGTVIIALTLGHALAAVVPRDP